MNVEFEELKKAYAAELRATKDAADLWWKDLQETYVEQPGRTKPADLWPMGPASHPWVIATYRKYFFLCQELNKKVSADIGGASGNGLPDGEDWGSEEPSAQPGTIEPKVFVLDMLSGGETHDLYEFLLSLVFVPIGLKADEPV